LVHSLTSGAARALASFVHGLGALALPTDCLVCAETLERPLEGPICAPCLSALPRVEAPCCSRCGLPYPAGVAPGLCGDCREPSRPFRRARALTVYEGPVRLCLHALKFRGRRRVASLLGRMAAERWMGSGELEPGAAVVPVPLSRKRRRERGYNQAELVARPVARIARLPLLTGALVKPAERPPQSGLSAAARRRNARAAYQARLPARFEGAHLLLVDDVFTTGATVEAASAALLGAGAASVDVLTLSRVPRAVL